jgi:hypothetical protein
MRMDLEGVALKDPSGRVLCVFRYRTTAGILVNLPESVDVTIPWGVIDDAQVDLKSGQVRIRFNRTEGRPRWLEDVDVVEGTWTDRGLLTGVP